MKEGEEMSQVARVFQNMELTSKVRKEWPGN